MKYSVLFAPLILALSAGASATVYDASTDFSILSNPNGVWSYGTSTSLGGPFSFYMNGGTNSAGIEVWASDLDFPAPAVLKNATSGEKTQYTFDLRPGELAFHPGNGGVYSIIRFTATNSGLYDYSADFTGRDTVGSTPGLGTTTDVHVLQGSTSLYNGYVQGFQDTPNAMTSGSVFLTAGQTLSVVVGDGGNGYGYDTTGVNFRIASVPGPGAAAAFGLGFPRRRKRR